MGMMSIQSFLPMWTGMTAVMMAPSALPFIIATVRRSRPWPLMTAVVVLAYLLAWTVFGLAVFVISDSVMLPWPAGVGIALAIAFAVVYSFTRLRRAGAKRCLAMCRAAQPPRGLSGALRCGITYGASCVACSAGVMVALVAIGMTNPVWIVLGALAVLLYRYRAWPELLRNRTGYADA